MHWAAHMQIWFRLFLRSIANTKFPEAFCICNLQIWMQREVQKGLMHTLWKLTNLSWLLLALFLPPQNIFWVTCNQNPFMVQAHTGDTLLISSSDWKIITVLRFCFPPLGIVLSRNQVAENDQAFGCSLDFFLAW